MVDHRITDKVMIVAEDAKALTGLDIRELERPRMWRMSRSSRTRHLTRRRNRR